VYQNIQITEHHAIFVSLKNVFKNRLHRGHGLVRPVVHSKQSENSMF